jgi:hypothetical protein
MIEARNIENVDENSDAYIEMVLRIPTTLKFVLSFIFWVSKLTTNVDA